MTDLQTAYEAIKAKQDHHNTAFNYYDGNHPLIYSTTRMEELFRNLNTKFIENWTAVVIDSLKERIQLSGFTVPEIHQSKVQEIWDKNTLALESDDLHEALIITGEAFVIVQEAVDGIPEIFYNDPRLCTAVYKPDNPRVMQYAGKMWVEADKTSRLTLYYPDRIEYYRTKGEVDTLSGAGSFISDETIAPGGVAKNPWDKIPVFHFRTSRRALKGGLFDIIPLQDAINKLLTDMMVSADYGAFKQRYIISNANITQLKNAPNEIWDLPAGDGTGQDTTVGEFDATNLNNYLDAINQLAGDIARISRTPKHYFYGQAGDPSGEALIAMESPLLRKVADHVERLDPSWKAVMAFAMSLAGITLKDSEIVTKWETVETVQPRTRAEIRLLGRQADMPLTTLLKREGWTDDEVDAMVKDLSETQSAMTEKLLEGFEKGQG